MTTPANPYAAQSVQTASPAQLVTMLYDRILVALSRARQAVTSDRTAGFGVVNAELQRAQDILAELRHTLDHDNGGAIAGNLDALYGYCLERVVRANVTKELNELDVVERIVGDLRAAWAEACQSGASQVSGMSGAGGAADAAGVAATAGVR